MGDCPLPFAKGEVAPFLFLPSLPPSVPPPPLPLPTKGKERERRKRGEGQILHFPRFIKGDTGTNLFRTPLAEPSLAGTILDLEVPGRVLGRARLHGI